MTKITTHIIMNITKIGPYTIEEIKNFKPEEYKKLLISTEKVMERMIKELRDNYFAKLKIQTEWEYELQKEAIELPSIPIQNETK